MPVVSGAALQVVITTQAIESIVARAANNGVGQRVAGAEESTAIELGQVLQIGGQGIAGQRGTYRIGSAIDRFDDLVADAVHHIGVVANATGHQIVAHATVEQIVAVTALQRIVAPQPIEHIVAAQALDQLGRRGTVEDIVALGTDDDARQHRSSRRRQRLQGIAVIGVADHHPDLLPGLSYGRGKAWACGAGDIGEVAARAGLPLVGERHAGQSIGIGKGIDRREFVTQRRRHVTDQHTAHRQIVRITSLNQAGRRREHGFQHAVGVLVDRLDAQGQALELRRYSEVRPGSTGGLAADVFRHDIFEGTVALRIHLPVVADRPGDGAVRITDADVVGVAHQRSRDAEHLADTGRAVADTQYAFHLGIASFDQHHGLVIELDALDIADHVRAIGADHIELAIAVVVNGRRADMTHAPQAVAPLDHFILGHQPRVDRRIEGLPEVVRVDRTGHQLAEDDQLPRVVGAVEHQRDHRHHAVEGGDFRARTVVVRTHADTHVEPHVTVDQVVTAITGDQVAAIAAEDDIARAKGGDLAGGGQWIGQLVDERPQAVDQVHIVVAQHAAVGTGQSDGRGVAVVAVEDVGMLRAGQPFHELETRQHRHIGRCHRRFVEGAQTEVDVDPERIVAEARPVEAGATDVAVALAAVAEHDVVTTLAVHAVDDAELADEHVMADHIVQAELVEVVAAVAVGAAQFQPVVAFVTELRLVAAGAEDEVVARAAEHLGGVLAGDDEVLAVASHHQIDAVAGMHHVVAFAGADDVVTAHVGDDVVAGPAHEQVVAEAALQAVVTGVAPQGVIADAAHQGVIAVRAAEHHVLAAVVLQ